MDPPPRWQDDRQWLRGLDLFDLRYYWESHEQWEAMWHQVPRRTVASELLQGLIQGSAFVLKLHLGHEAGAGRLLSRATQRLRFVEAEAGPRLWGLEVGVVVPRLEAFAAGGPWPGLHDQARPESTAPEPR